MISLLDYNICLYTACNLKLRLPTDNRALLKLAINVCVTIITKARACITQKSVSRTAVVHLSLQNFSDTLFTTRRVVRATFLPASTGDTTTLGGTTRMTNDDRMRGTDRASGSIYTHEVNTRNNLAIRFLMRHPSSRVSCTACARTARLVD